MEILDFFCSDIFCDVLEFFVIFLFLKVENVLFEKLFVIKEKIKEVLGNIVDGKEFIDMKCMGVVIYCKILDIKNKFENCLYDIFVDIIVSDFLYFFKLEDF